MIDAAGSHHLLQARICRPLGDAPSRVVVIAHGTFPNNRNAVPGHCGAETPRWFLDRGFIVVMALRRGYGATGGDWAEGIYHRPGDDYALAGLETARDIAATVDYGTAPPFARPQAAVVIGHSGGGWGAMAYNSVPHPQSASPLAEYLRTCRSYVPRRAIPCSEPAQQRHNIIPNRVALVSEESVSVVTVGTAPTPTGDPTHAHLYHWQ